MDAAAFEAYKAPAEEREAGLQKQLADERKKLADAKQRIAELEEARDDDIYSKSPNTQDRRMTSVNCEDDYDHLEHLSTVFDEWDRKEIVQLLREPYSEIKAGYDSLIDEYETQEMGYDNLEECLMFIKIYKEALRQKAAASQVKTPVRRSARLEYKACRARGTDCRWKFGSMYEMI